MLNIYLIFFYTVKNVTFLQNVFLNFGGTKKSHFLGTSCHFLQCVYCFLKVLLLFNIPYMSTLLFWVIPSWLKKLSKIMEGGSSQK